MSSEKASLPVLIHQITPRNFLSFGPNTEPIKLQSLNVLIGTNGCGKSNLIEAIALLRATAFQSTGSSNSPDVRSVISRGGGVQEWIWKGAPVHSTASIDAIVDNPKGEQSLRHVFAFKEEGQRFQLSDERVEDQNSRPGESEPYFYYRYQDGQPIVIVKDQKRELRREVIEMNGSVLLYYRDPDAYPGISYLGSIYEKIRIYREWAFGRNTVFRQPQDAAARNDTLQEDFSNLGLVLSRFLLNPRAKTKIIESLRELYENFSDFTVHTEGGTVQVFFTEGDFSIPATRLSDGTLRYLCLSAILCDPTPPPLICIEEPELGLHPDILPDLAELLLDASKRTQLIVTTHSDILVDALTEFPESILVCEKQDGQTIIKRLNRVEMSEWLDKYRLGELWTRGELGGTRW